MTNAMVGAAPRAPAETSMMENGRRAKRSAGAPLSSPLEARTNGKRANHRKGEEILRRCCSVHARQQVFEIRLTVC
jgi:hypothetical protein